MTEATIITKNKVFVVPMTLMRDIWDVLMERRGIKAFKDVEPCQKIDYHLYELMSVKIHCCASHECKSRQLISDYLDELYKSMESSTSVLFLCKSVTRFELDVYREIMVLVDRGFSLEDARFFVGNSFKFES